MSTGSHPEPHRFHWPRRWVLWMVIGLVVAPVAAVGICVGIYLAGGPGEAATEEAGLRRATTGPSKTRTREISPSS